MKKVCFISPRSYSIFNPVTKQVFGGSELRAYLLGSRLAKTGKFQVDFMVFNPTKRQKEVFEDITVYSEIRKLSSWQSLQAWLTPRMNKRKMLEKCQTQVYQKIDANLYIAFGVGVHTFYTFSKLNSLNKTKMLFLGHDEDLSEKYYEGSTYRNRHGYLGDQCWQAIQMADYFVAQTDFQAGLLKERFGKEAFVLRNPIDLGNKVSPSVPDEEKFILWIGRSNRVKRPEIMIEIAKRMPGFQFVMIMNQRDKEIHNKIYAAKPENVTIHDFIPIDKIEQFFANAKLFVSTSEGEGFPNTFLQAGKYGVPVVSMQINPDNFITRYQCGTVTGDDIDCLEKSIKELLSGFSEKYQIYAENITEYVKSQHSLEGVSTKLCSLLTGKLKK